MRPPGRRSGSTGITVVIALLLVGAALYVRPKIFATPAGSAVVAGVPIPGTDVTSWGNAHPADGWQPTGHQGHLASGAGRRPS